MSDLATQLQQVLKKAAEYELLASSAADDIKKEEYRIRAQFYQDIAKELRAELANQPDRPIGGRPLQMPWALVRRRLSGTATFLFRRGTL